MLRHAGWSLDWRRIVAAEVHAARYVAAATLDSSLLVDALRPGQAVLTVTAGNPKAEAMIFVK